MINRLRQHLIFLMLATTLLLGFATISGCNSNVAEERAKTPEEQLEEDKSRQQRELEEVRSE